MGRADGMDPLLGCWCDQRGGAFLGISQFQLRRCFAQYLSVGHPDRRGELHNNHHTFATSAKLSARWYEFDIGWAYIRILVALGLAKVKKLIPVPRFTHERRVVDLDLLQTVISHRYDVMARYVASLKSVYGDEVARLRGEFGEFGERFDVKRLRAALLADAQSLSASAKQQLAEMLARSPKLEMAYTMRQELLALWARSSVSREQLLAQLQDWWSAS